MGETEVLKQEKLNNLFMGKLFQLEELAQEFAKELDISLQPSTKDSGYSYWTTGKNDNYTLDHTIACDYEIVTEQIRVGSGEEFWKAKIISHPEYKEFFLEYLGHRSHAEKYKEKVFQLCDEMPFELFEALLAELHVVTDKKYLDKEKRMRGELLPPNEEINVRVELSSDDFKVLPKFIKNFYS